MGGMRGVWATLWRQPVNAPGKRTTGIHSRMGKGSFVISEQQAKPDRVMLQPLRSVPARAPGRERRERESYSFGRWVEP